MCHLVTYDQDTADGAGAMLAENSDGLASLGLAVMEKRLLLKQSRTLNYMNSNGRRRALTSIKRLLVVYDLGVYITLVWEHHVHPP